MWALVHMHSPGLSRSSSGSRVLHKGSDLVGPTFCACPRSEQLRWPGVGTCSCSQLKGAAYPLPHPSRSVFWVYNGCAFSGVPCVSSGKLISGCDPPGGCQPFRIPISLGYQQSLLAVWYRIPFWGCNCPLRALASPACLQWAMGRSTAG